MSSPKSPRLSERRLEMEHYRGVSRLEAEEQDKIDEIYEEIIVIPRDKKRETRI